MSIAISASVITGGMRSARANRFGRGGLASARPPERDLGGTSSEIAPAAAPESRERRPNRLGRAPRSRAESVAVLNRP